MPPRSFEARGVEPGVTHFAAGPAARPLPLGLSLLVIAGLSSGLWAALGWLVGAVLL